MKIVLAWSDIVLETDGFFEEVEYELRNYFVFWPEKIELVFYGFFAESWEHWAEFVDFHFVSHWDEVGVKLLEYDWNHFLLERLYDSFVVDEIHMIIHHVNGLDKVAVKKELEELVSLIF